RYGSERKRTPERSPRAAGSCVPRIAAIWLCATTKARAPKRMVASTLVRERSRSAVRRAPTKTTRKRAFVRSRTSSAPFIHPSGFRPQINLSGHAWARGTGLYQLTEGRTPVKPLCWSPDTAGRKSEQFACIRLLIELRSAFGDRERRRSSAPSRARREAPDAPPAGGWAR